MNFTENPGMIHKNISSPFLEMIHLVQCCANNNPLHCWSGFVLRVKLEILIQITDTETMDRPVDNGHNIVCSGSSIPTFPVQLQYDGREIVFLGHFEDNEVRMMVRSL